jgi:hypothetical protein
MGEREGDLKRPGPAPGVITTPRSNPDDRDQADIDKGKEKLEKVVGN